MNKKKLIILMFGLTLFFQHPGYANNLKSLDEVKSSLFNQMILIKNHFSSEWQSTKEFQKKHWENLISKFSKKQKKESEVN